MVRNNNITRATLSFTIYTLLCKQNVKNHHHLIEGGELMHFLSNTKARTFY